MRKTWAVVRRELIAYFSSPLAYVVMTGFLLIQGFVFERIVSILNNPQVPAMTPLRAFFVLGYGMSKGNRSMYASKWQ